MHLTMSLWSLLDVTRDRGHWLLLDVTRDRGLWLLLDVTRDRGHWLLTRYHPVVNESIKQRQEV